MKIFLHEDVQKSAIDQGLSDVIHSIVHVPKVDFVIDNNNEDTVYIMPLSQAPFLNEKSPWIIAALSQRMIHHLSISSKVWQEELPLWLPHGYSLHSEKTEYSRQAAHLRPDLNISSSIGDIASIFVNQQDFKVTRKLHPSEITPVAGEFVNAYIVRKSNLEFRRLLQTVHHISTGRCTNIERSLWRNHPNSLLGAFCHMDDKDRYHLYLAQDIGQEIVKHRWIQRTWHGLLEIAEQKIMEASTSIQ